MGKRVFMFPGQGSQYIGMGKEFYDNFPVAKEVFDKASEITGLDVASLCFEENDKINITEYILRRIWCINRIRCHEYGRCICSC